ncbi:MAG: hypothetical protein ACXAC2_07625, partial [Candidatus Kariarchaeaceae archaeon]
MIFWTLSVTIYSYELLTGKIINNYIAKLITSTYLIGSIFYILVLRSELSIEISRLLTIIFALPQIGIYVFKIARKKEFTFAKTKLFIRLMFIVSFFFSLINFSNDRFGSLIIIFFGILIFTKTRKFSDYRINNDKHLVSIVDTTKGSLVS